MPAVFRFILLVVSPKNSRRPKTRGPERVLNPSRPGKITTAHSDQHQYDLAGVKLQEAHQEKDLGVKVSSTLKPSLRYTKAAAKAMEVLGIIKRNLVMRDEEDCRLLFSGYVRPHLEYCVQVWSLYLKKDIECFEKVQRRATKLVKDSCPVCHVRALWPNGWTDQDETWHAGRPRPWPHCFRWRPSSLSPKGAQTPNFRPISVAAKWLHGSRCHLVWR